MLVRVKSQPVDRNFLLYLLVVEVFFIAAFFLNHGWAPRVLITTNKIMHRAYHPFNDPPLNQPAPSLLATNLSGTIVNLAAAVPHFQVITFFPSCRECSLKSMLEVQALQDTSQNLQVQALTPEASQDIKSFLASHHLHLNFYTNSSAQNEKSYNIAWYPRLFLLNPKGRLVYIQGQDQTFSNAVRKVAEITAPSNSPSLP